MAAGRPAPHAWRRDAPEKKHPPYEGGHEVTDYKVMLSTFLFAVSMGLGVAACDDRKDVGDKLEDAADEVEDEIDDAKD